jgi:photosystem II Psb28-2 protein
MTNDQSQMTNIIPSIQFFAGILEELSNVSLRRNTRNGNRVVVMMFDQLQAISGFNSFTKQSLNSLLLTDEEGEISVTPSSTQFIFGGDEGDELRRVECKFEIESDEHWDRFMRFMHRYAEANGMEYGER